MTEKAARSTPDTPHETPAQALATSMAGVVDAALEVGVSLARVVAQATAPGRPVEAPAANTSPIEAIVRYGVTAMGNVASAAWSSTDGLRKAGSSVLRSAGSKAASATKTAPSARSAASSGPRVQPGATLRVPLSVENPGDTPMRELSPRVRAIRRAGADATSIIVPESVRFTPGLFDVAPRDFEKLTVYVPVPPDAPEGAYEVILALGDQEPDLPMAFTVLPAPAG
jgi:hypothetical protein